VIHRPLVVAREAFDGFPAPRDAAGAALVDGAVAELVAAADDFRVADFARDRPTTSTRGFSRKTAWTTTMTRPTTRRPSRGAWRCPRRRVGNSIV
jgi:hypothetical protein